MIVLTTIDPVALITWYTDFNVVTMNIDMIDIRRKRIDTRQY
jgi:hypothetical protein